MRQLLHLSDIHFGPMHLPPLAAAVDWLVEAGRPDLVVSSGDQTQRAKPGQFREARAWLEGLPVPSIAVPGNHDVPLYRAWERVFTPYGAYRRHFRDDLAPVWEDEELLVAGLNSAHGWTIKNGRLTRVQLAFLENVFADSGDPRLRIVVVHHPLLPAPDFPDVAVVRRADEARRLLSRLRVDIVLSGHHHFSYLQFIPERQYGPPVALLHAGTTTSSRGRGPEVGRNTCNWIDVRPEAVVVRRLVWQSEAGRFGVEAETLLPRDAAGRLTGAARDEASPTDSAT